VEENTVYAALQVRLTGDNSCPTGRCPAVAAEAALVKRTKQSQAHLMISDPRFWAKDLRTRIASDIRRFRETVQSKILPVFANLSNEADEMADKTYQRLGEQFDPDQDDPASNAEKAYEAGVEYYFEMKGIEQAVLNMFAAALYHLLEQQLLMFYRLEFLHGAPVVGQRKLEELYAALRDENINVKRLRSEARINELRLVATTGTERCVIPFAVESRLA